MLDSRVAEVEHGEAQEADVVDSHPEVEARPEAEVDLEAIVVVAAGSLDLVVSLAVVVLREDEAAAATSGKNQYEALAQAFVGRSVVERSLWRLCPVSDRLWSAKGKREVVCILHSSLLKCCSLR